MTHTLTMEGAKYGIRVNSVFRTGQDSDDVLGAAAVGLGAAAEVLWWVSEAGRGPGVGGCMYLFIE